jgi:putative DNA primase/helicase
MLSQNRSALQPTARRHSDDIKAWAHNCWPSILRRLGVDERLLDRKGHPCPVCKDGDDRFAFTDKFGNGDFYCRHCGHGDAFKLLAAVHGWSFSEALKNIEAVVGCGAPLPVTHKLPSSEDMKKVTRRIWEASQPVVAGDEVDRYLQGRGLGMSTYPSVIRCHPSLEFYDKGPDEKKSKLVARYPAMIAPLQDPDGNAVALHRTYLHEGRKAPVKDPKKVLNSFAAGPAIRLFEAGEALAITEGIETALAVHIATHLPVWAAYSASNLERLWVPDSVRRVRIYADHDASFTGHAAAYALARALKSREKVTEARDIQVFVPKKTGTDWADVLFAKRLRLAA